MRELHDSVIARLFKVGLSLQGTATLLVDPPIRDRVEHAIEELDATIREIRMTTFAFEVASRRQRPSADGDEPQRPGPR